jgi:hypothetical protein
VISCESYSFQQSTSSPCWPSALLLLLLLLLLIHRRTTTAKVTPSSSTPARWTTTAVTAATANEHTAVDTATAASSWTTVISSGQHSTAVTNVCNVQAGSYEQCQHYTAACVHKAVLARGVEPVKEASATMAAAL